MKPSSKFNLTLRLTSTILILSGSALSEPNPKPAVLALPLSFEANHGQAGSSVKFLSRGDGYALFLTKDSAVFKLRPSGKNKPPVLVRMKLAGAQPAQVSGAGPLPGKVNYFIGADPAKWTSGVATYEKVEYKQVYKGIDLVYYGKQRQLEYDFKVSPGADAARIALEFSGAKPILDAGGELQLTIDGAPLRFRKPVAYQIDGGARKIIPASYKLSGGRVQFKLGRYDHSRALILDPVLDYMTYLGGTGNDQIGWPAIVCPQCTGNPPQAIAVDQAGNVYVTGYTMSTDFPFQNSVQSQNQAAANSPQRPTAFVAEIDPTASTLIYSTYLGGSAWDQASAIAVDSSGSAYVTGYTFSPDFPVTPGAFQTRCGAAAGNNASIVSNCGAGSNSNVFLTKLSPGGGSLAYSTFLGGGGLSIARGVAVDSQGQAYIAGVSQDTCSAGQLPGNSLAKCFPETANALLPQALYNSTVTKGTFNPTSAFVAVFDTRGANLLYSTLYGDTNPANSPTNAQASFGTGVAVDPAGNFYLAGVTSNPEIPTTPGAFLPTYSNFVAGNANTLHGFVAKFSPVTGVAAGASLMYGTYLGGAPPNGSPGEQVAGIVADASGAYVTGLVQSYTFPITPGANNTNSCSQTSDCQNIGFLTKISPDGSALVWSTLVGANPADQSFGRGTVFLIGPPRVDADGDVYITGQGGFSGQWYYPLVNSLQPQPPTQQSGVFVTKYDPTGSTIAFSTVIYSPSGAGVVPGGVDVDSQGNIYVAGTTFAPDLPTTSDVFQPAFAGTAGFSSNHDGIIALINPFLSATIQLSVSPNSVNAGTPVTFTATLTGVSDRPTPAGTVNFLNGAKVLGSGTLDANGVATFSSTALASGVYSITAVYSGGGVYSSVTSDSQALTMN